MNSRHAPVLLVALALVGCGGDNNDPTPGAGASGATGAAGPATDITAGEFLMKLRDEKEVALEGIVATSEACAGTEVGAPLLLLVSEAAANADPEAPVTPIVEAEC